MHPPAPTAAPGMPGLSFAESFSVFAKRTTEALPISSPSIAGTIARAFRHFAKIEYASRDGGLKHFPPASPLLLSEIDALFTSPPSLCIPLFTAAADLSRHLSWRMAGGGKSPVLGVAEIIGPDGAVKCSDCRAGLFYQPAHFFYARHKHAAEEIYLPLCGGATWCADGRDAIKEAAGGCIVHHASWQPHSSETADTPLLAMWGWTGDLRMETYQLCDDTCGWFCPPK